MVASLDHNHGCPLGSGLTHLKIFAQVEALARWANCRSSAEVVNRDGPTDRTAVRCGPAGDRAAGSAELSRAGSTPIFAARSRNWVSRPGHSHLATQPADPNQRLDGWLLPLTASRPLGTPFAL